MQNVSSLKSNTINSPKTPGGISKSLLTPCRRVGLSRNWRNKGPSPFISPLSGNTPVVKEEPINTKKRKVRVLEDNVELNPETSPIDENEIKDDESTDIDKTPSRNVELSHRKKSKTLLAVISKPQDDISTCDDKNTSELNEDISEVDNLNTENVVVVSTPVRKKSKKSKSKIQSPKLKSNVSITTINSKEAVNMCNDVSIDNPDNKLMQTTDTVYKVKEKSPNDLRKECIVVIQRKIFKKTEENDKETDKESINKDKIEKSSSQVLFDSDSDEVPLIELNSKDIAKTEKEKTKGHKQTTTKLECKKDLNEDDDFIDKTAKVQVNKVKVTKSPKNKLKISKNNREGKVKEQAKPLSQSSFDDDDDFDNKKTIIIRKTYEKVSKPLKAKSTGSITQKDIEELKARIEAKKKLLLAKSISPDTEELRTLIKKWQKGCQDALMELMDLMKTKFHDKQDMDYSEMLKTLKIPPSLVGYDSENDCFNSPDDASIILGDFKDI